MSASMSLVNDEILIEEVRSRSILYDKSHPSYYLREKKARVWREVSQALGCPGQGFTHRWKNLRDRYVKEKNKYIPSGSGYEAVLPRWPLMGIMSFLDPYIKTRQTSSNMSEEPLSSSLLDDTLPTTSVATSSSVPDNMLPTTSVATPLLDNPPATSVESVDAPSRPAKRGSRKRRHPRDDDDDDVQAVLKALQHGNREPSADELFMASMGKELATIKDITRRARIKFQIHKLIQDGIMEEVECSTSDQGLPQWP